MVGINMKRAALTLAVLSPWLLGGWGSPKNSIEISVDFSTGQLVPQWLPHPETWICLGVKTDSHKTLRQALWVNPVGDAPREIPSDPQQKKAAFDQAMAYCQRPLEEFTQPISESFSTWT
jgi:hypothetical protein